MTAEKVTFINSRGHSIELSNRLPFLLESVEGRGGVEANVQMQSAPFQDGSTFIDTTLSTRSLALHVNLLAESRDELNSLRHQISSIFNPKLGLGKLIYSNGNFEREIDVIVDGSPAYPVGDAKGKWYQRTVINLVAPNPFWLDTLSSVDEMSVFVGKFEFPLEFTDSGIEFGDQGEEVIITNTGDVPTPVRIEFNGPAVNPKVTNITTGEYILVNRSIAEEEKLVLVTEFGNKKVEIHREDGSIENAFSWIDLDSIFWSLLPGNNLISYEADVGMDKARVFISYKNRYLAV